VNEMPKFPGGIYFWKFSEFDATETVIVMQKISAYKLFSRVYSERSKHSASISHLNC
jgi:hypothetical protein